MAKLDKRLYTKEQWHQLRAQRKLDKAKKRANKSIIDPEQVEKVQIYKKHSNAFVIGNGTSRSPINIEDLSTLGNTYGCNALYRTFSPDYLVAVDVKMILEISKSMFQHKNQVWTNYNKSYEGIQNLNYFQPGKGWSSGPTALWLASQHRHKRIYILGFDYKGLKEGQRFNNLYADTPNYKKSQDSATFYGNWLRQTESVVAGHEKSQFIRVIAPDNYCPEQLNKHENYSTITVEEFKNTFVLP